MWRRWRTCTPAILELVHRLHQADIPLLDEIQELEAPVGVLLRDRDHQPEVRLDQLPLGFADFPLPLLDGGERLLDLPCGKPRLPLHLPDDGPRLLEGLLD